MAALSFPISLLCTVKGELGPLSKVDEQLEGLSMRLRLTGRDMMRIGAALDRFFATFTSGIGKVMMGSMDWMAGLEDIQWALEDVGAVIGDTFAPFLELVADLLENLAEFLEANPWAVYAIGIILIIAVLGRLIAKITQTVGMLNIWFGVLMRVKAAHMGLGASLKGFLHYMKGGSSELNRYIVSTTKATEGQQVLLKEIGGPPPSLGIGKALAGIKGGISGSVGKLKGFLTGTKKTTKGTVDFSESLVDSTGNLKDWGISSEKGGKKAKKLGKDTKGAISPLGALGGMLGIFGLFIGLIMAAEPIMELFQDIMDAISPALDAIVDAIEPVISAIADWIEENPAMAAGIIAAIAAIFILLSVGDTLMSFIGGLLAIFKTGTAVALPLLKTQILQIAEAIFILAGAVSMLVISLGAAIFLMTATGRTLPEIITLLWNLVGAVLILGTVFITMAALVAVGGITLAALSPVLLPIALLLLAIGAAAFLVGAGFALAGIGINLAAAGILNLVGYIPQLLVLLPLVLGLAGGFLALGIAAGIAIIPLFGLSLAFVALAASIMLIAGALKFLQAIGLGGVAEAIGRGIAVSLVPKLEVGGTIIRGGLAEVHAGEEIRPAAAVRKREVAGPSTVNVNFYGPVTSRDFVDREVVPVVKKAIHDELRRT